MSIPKKLTIDHTAPTRVPDSSLHWPRSHLHMQLRHRLLSSQLGDHPDQKPVPASISRIINEHHRSKAEPHAVLHAVLFRDARSLLQVLRVPTGAVLDHSEGELPARRRVVHRQKALHVTTTTVSEDNVIHLWRGGSLCFHVMASIVHLSVNNLLPGFLSRFSVLTFKLVSSS